MVTAVQLITESQDVSIASGQSLSSAVNLSGRVIVGIIMPGTWTAANLTLQGSMDNSTFYDVYDIDGTELTITAAASRYIVLDPVNYPSLKYLKLRSGTTGTPVNQGGARTIGLLTAAL